MELLIILGLIWLTVVSSSFGTFLAITALGTPLFCRSGAIGPAGGHSGRAGLGQG
jgi:hypothetical protein